MQIVQALQTLPLNYFDLSSSQERKIDMTNNKRKTNEKNNLVLIEIMVELSHIQSNNKNCSYTSLVNK